MLTAVLTVVTLFVTLSLFVLWFVISRSKGRETVYVCDICNARDCVCRAKH